MARPLTNEQIAQIDTSQLLGGYPPFSDRLRIDPKIWSKMLSDNAITIPDAGPWHVANHPNRVQAPKKLKHLVQPLEPDSASISYWQKLGLVLDQKNRPLHPYADQLVTTIGMATGPGFYWKYGPNATTNLIVRRQQTGMEPEFFVIKRTDQGQRWALPGGFIDNGETPAQAALREFKEELGLPVAHWGSTALVGTIVSSGGKNARDTLHAWTEDNAVALLVKDQTYLWDAPFRPNPKEVAAFAWKSLHTLQQDVARGVFGVVHLKFIEAGERARYAFTID